MAFMGAIAAAARRRAIICGTYISIVLSDEDEVVKALQVAWQKITSRSKIIGFSEHGYLLYERDGATELNSSIQIWRYQTDKLLVFDLYDGSFGDNFMLAYYLEEELRNKQEEKKEQ